MSIKNPINSHEPAIGMGIAYMCAGAFCMVGLDATARWLLQTYSLPQMVVLRCLFSVSFIVAFVAARGEFGSLRTARPGWHLFRSLMMSGSMFAFFHALRFIPLADIMVIAFAAPLIVTSLSRFVLGEQVGVWRWSAVIIGFIGVLIVVRPGGGIVHPSALLALGGAVLYAGLLLTARKLSTTESTAALSLYLFVVPLLIGLVVGADHWEVPNATGWALFAVCGGFGGLSFVLINGAYRRAPAAAVVPFEYTGLIWAAAAGYLIWGEIPTLNTWVGALIIVTSGLVIVFRETAVRRRRGRVSALQSR
jgi:drug/metabolite transporter (DMT)-like permease